MFIGTLSESNRKSGILHRREFRHSDEDLAIE
jgi:hypothetical protein